MRLPSLLLALFSVPILACSQTADRFAPNPDSSVFGLAVGPDETVITTGVFKNVDETPRGNVAQLLPGGGVDRQFVPSTDAFNILTFIRQPDGKTVIGGGFTSVSGVARANIARLHADGSVDLDFNPGWPTNVHAMALQPDGKIIVTARAQGINNNPIRRLNPDGTIDPTFTAQATNAADTIAIQPDGKILVGGFSLNGAASTALVRLNPNGTPDTSFSVAINDSIVNALLVQPDGKILVGGSFNTVSGTPRKHIARLNPNGSVDTGFSPGASGSVESVYSFALQADGKILVAGSFTTLAGGSRDNLGRLNPDGTLDSSFNAGTNSSVNGLALQRDGKLLVCGSFGLLAGAERFVLGRLSNSGPATETLSRNGSTLSWLRGGASPEVGRTTFEYSVDQITWVPLNAGTRVSGGWQSINQSIPTGASIRARGYFNSGFGNVSTSIVESTLGPLAITRQPASRAAKAGYSVEFSVYVIGTGPLNYQWRKNGVNLFEDQGRFGTNTSSLILDAVTGNDAGSYSVVVTGPTGEATSTSATLTVIDPRIVEEPLGQFVLFGRTATLSATAAGALPFSYQWRRDGIALPGATEATYTIPKADTEDTGTYDVVITNAYGSVTSGGAKVVVSSAVADELDPLLPEFTLFTVRAVALQENGYILFGGDFSPVQLGPRYFARAKADGTLDYLFESLVEGPVDAIAVRPNGRILVGGTFYSVGGVERPGLAQLHPDGTLDETFDPQLNVPISNILLLPDGKILVAGSGYISELGGNHSVRIARLLANGTVDATFDAGSILGGDDSPGVISALALQSDGRILVGGRFASVAGVPRANLARLQPNGVLDSTFTAGTEAGGVDVIAVQRDQRILVGGQFATLAGVGPRGLGRLLQNGTRDASFVPPAATSGATSIALTADGRMLVAGFFSLPGQPFVTLVHLDVNGALDPVFNPGLEGAAMGVALQEDGRATVVGRFTSVAGKPRASVARLEFVGPAIQELRSTGSTVRWLRSGGIPEPISVHFESSINGEVWTPLGTGTRTDVGWEINNVPLPSNAGIRARAFFQGGDGSGSGWSASTLHFPGGGPRLTAPRQESGQFTCDLAGPAGWKATIEASEDLRVWTPLLNMTIGANPLLFKDQASSIFTKRFYRARLQ